MVAIARHLNVTLIVPELDKASFWADSRFADHSFVITSSFETIPFWTVMIDMSSLH